MEKSTKRLILRFIFWGSVLTAPVVFFSMGLIYLNAYLTEDRVNFVMIPVFETLSGRTVQIESTGAHLGFTSSLEFRNVNFHRKTAELNAAYSPVDASVNRIYLQFKPITMFARIFQVDSVLIDGFHGILKYDPERSYLQYDWNGGDESRRLQVNLEHSDLGNIHIKSLLIKNAAIHYFHQGLNLEYLIEDFYKDVELEGFRVMNMLLVNGHVGGVLKDPETGERFTDVLLTGRLQINFDDRTFIIRGGRMTIDNSEFLYTAFLNEVEDTLRLSIIFEEPREIIEEAFKKLPPSIEQWLRGELPGSRYRVHINYSGDHAADQT